MRRRQYLAMARCLVATTFLLVSSIAAAPLAAPAESISAAADSSPAAEPLGEAKSPVAGSDDPLRVAGDSDNPSAKLEAGELYDRTTTSRFSLSFLFILLGILFQQAGFSLYERGLASDRRADITWRRNLLIVPLGACAFWAYGFAIGWGNWFNGPTAPGWLPTLGPGLALLNRGLGLGPSVADSGAFQYGLSGAKGFFLIGLGDVSVMSVFFLMLQFLITAMTIPGGAMAERWSTRSAALYCLWVVFPFSLYANWIWGGGWLAQAGLNWGLGHGAVDLAGSGVVHAMGGMIALAGCLAIGRREQGAVDSAPRTINWQKTAALLLGTLILIIYWGGWDIRLTPVANLLLAGLAAAIGALLMAVVVRSRVTPATLCRGFLSGIVACTAACIFVDRLGAAAIGAVAGPLMVLSMKFWECRGIDDVTGAISVNGACGLWGLVALGLFADGRYGDGWSGVVRNEWVQRSGSDGVRGLIYGDGSQLLAQLLAAAVVIVFGLGTAYAFFRISNRFVPLRSEASPMSN